MFEYYWWYENYAKLDRIYYILIMFSADINSTCFYILKRVSIEGCMT